MIEQADATGNHRAANPLVEQFRNYSTEYLLERRALGEDGLSIEAHEAIEYLLTDRGVSFPPIPKRSVPTDKTKTEHRRSRLAMGAVAFVAVLFAMAVSKTLAHTWVGVVIALVVVGAAIADWIRRARLSDQDRNREDDQKRVEDEALTELMQAAAVGDGQRVKDLLGYGTPLNATSRIGSTALMYAARNNHPDIVDALLAAGGDPAIKTKKGSTARDLAAKAGHQDIVAILDRAAGHRPPPEVPPSP